MKGWALEERYRTRPHRYTALLRDPHILSPEELARLVHTARARRRLSAQEAYDLGEADVVVRGRPRTGRGVAYLVVEVSATVDAWDVERARYRAQLLEKALRGQRPRPVVHAAVAGLQMFREARQAARTHGVWWLRDGKAFPPQEIPEEGPELSGPEGAE